MALEVLLMLLIMLLTLLCLDCLSTTGEEPSSDGTSKLARTPLRGASPTVGGLVWIGNLVAGGSLDRSLR